MATDLNNGGTEAGFSGGWVGSSDVFISQSTDLIYTTPNFTSADFTTIDFMDSVSRVGVPIVWDGVNSSQVDAIRLSDTTTAFTDVTGVIIVPEPSVGLLGGIGALFLLRRRRSC